MRVYLVVFQHYHYNLLIPVICVQKKECFCSSLIYSIFFFKHNKQEYQFHKYVSR